MYKTESVRRATDAIKGMISITMGVIVGIISYVRMGDYPQFQGVFAVLAVGFIAVGLHQLTGILE